MPMRKLSALCERQPPGTQANNPGGWFRLLAVTLATGYHRTMRYLPIILLAAHPALAADPSPADLRKIPHGLSYSD